MPCLGISYRGGPKNPGEDIEDEERFKATSKNVIPAKAGIQKLFDIAGLPPLRE